MADPVDMIVRLLREMRAENAALQGQTRELIKVFGKRIAASESALLLGFKECETR